MKILYQNVSLKIITHFSRHDGKQTYIEIFRQLNFCFSYDSVLYLDGFNMMNKNQNRFFLMIDKKVPLVTILRDPIERFLPLVNHLMYNKDAKYEFRLDDDLNNMLNSIRYYDGDNILSCYPNVNNIKTYECGYKSNVNFSLKSRIQYLKNVTKILYIEMDKIIGEDTLKTMKMLSHILGFHIPNSIDRKKFGGKINGGDFLGLIPRKLRITCNDFSEILEKKKDILITISTFQHTPVKFYNITQKILQEKLFNSEIIIFTDTKEDFDIIQRDQKLFNRLNECLKEFVQILEKQIKKENSKRIQLNEILDFFRCNKDVYNYFKKVFDYELQDVKKNNPKLIDKWYTYKEFNKISDSF
ncbi:DUF2972 domain-containing protein [Campylobacter jejuni]|nr:DUF2972 domain-containing protein [Campylobacter jejuni]EGN5848833.1 DUF2972 domain-containing protein [Campylobacter jejuni]HEG2430666.1 DUF2972 domain-containing protein [Campylobacter jejuni]HEG2432523.1 DUF2972 domain-containing protein [Campylobacter jejuni]